MALGVEMITFDCTDPDRLADWWAAAVSGRVTPVMAGEFVVVVPGRRTAAGLPAGR